MSRQCWTQCFFFIVVICCVYQGWSVIPGLNMDYIFYTVTRSWNDARSECQSIGGDLATLDSQEVINILYDKADEAYPAENVLAQNKPYWTGLVKLIGASRQWVSDCSILTLPSVYTNDSSSDKMCYRIEATVPDPFSGIAASCDELNAFLCERRSDAQCTSFRTMFGGVLSTLLTGKKTQQECEDSCQNDVNCQYVMLLSSTKCYHFSTVSGDSSSILRYKFCATFVRNTTTNIGNGDNSKTPDTVCGSNAKATSTIAWSLTPSSSYLPTSTLNIMATCLPIMLTELVTALVSSPCECSAPSLLLTTTVTSSLSCVSSSIPSTTCAVQLNTVTVAMNLSRQEAVQVAEEIKKNLTIDAKTTSSYIRSLTSASDFRKTATAMGLVGIACITFPMIVLIFLDFRRFLDDIRGIRKVLSREAQCKRKSIYTNFNNARDSLYMSYPDGCFGDAREIWEETSKGKSGIKIA